MPEDSPDIPLQQTSPAAQDVAIGLPASKSPAGIPHYRYSDLSHSGSEVIIEHEGQSYRLRMTRNGKLIMNK